MSIARASTLLSTFSLIWVGACGADEQQDAAPAPVWQEAFPSFTKHQITDSNAGSYATAFDVDGDGLRDVVAISSGPAVLVWFKNPTWERFHITTGTERVIHTAPNDIDGDGDMDPCGTRTQCDPAARGLPRLRKGP